MTDGLPLPIHGQIDRATLFTDGAVGVFRLEGAPSAVLQIDVDQDWDATLAFEASANGVDWHAIAALNLETSANVASVQDAGGLFAIANLGLMSIRVRVTEYTDGEAIITAYKGNSQSRFFFAPLEAAAGEGTAIAKVGGLLASSTDEAATTEVTTLETLWSYTLPKNTIAEAGRGIRVTAWGKFGANGNTKNLFLNLGGDAVVARAATGNNVGWVMTMRVIRLTSGTYLGQGEVIAGTAAFASLPAAASEDFTTDLVVAMKSQNGSASAGDTVFQGAIVEYL